MLIFTKLTLLRYFFTLSVPDNFSLVAPPSPPAHAFGSPHMRGILLAPTMDEVTSALMNNRDSARRIRMFDVSPTQLSHR